MENFRDFPGGSVGKEPVYNAGDLGSIPRSGRSPGEGNGNPTPVFLPGKSHGQRSQAFYSQWGCKELDTTEHINTVQFSSVQSLSCVQLFVTP